MKDLLLALVCHLVTDPDAVEVKETRSDGTTILELKVAPHDLGRVIGRQGHTVMALRTLLRAIAARSHRRVVLEIVDITSHPK